MLSYSMTQQSFDINENAGRLDSKLYSICRGRGEVVPSNMTSMVQVILSFPIASLDMVGIDAVGRLVEFFLADQHRHVLVVEVRC